MKKFLLSLLFLMPLSGFAQKGMQGVGVNLGMGSDFLEGEYAYSYGFNYQIFLTDKFRLVSSLEILNYVYDDDDFWDSEYGYEYGDEPEPLYGTSYLLIVEGHYFFNDIRRLRPYVVGGISVGFSEHTGGYYISGGFYEIHYDYYEPGSEFAGGVKLGVGLNYRIGYHLTAQLEVPIHLVYPNPLFTPSLGLVYTF